MSPSRFAQPLTLLLFLPLLASAQAPACKPTVTGHVDTLRLTSKIFQNDRSLRVWLPPGYEDAANAQKKYKVLYVLDGQFAFDVCNSPFHQELGADEALTELIAAGKIEPLIAVAVDSPSAADLRRREYIPYPDPVVAYLQHLKSFRT
jgi:enterochelin esterase-like enzyme